MVPARGMIQKGTTSVRKADVLEVICRAHEEIKTRSSGRRRRGKRRKDADADGAFSRIGGASTQDFFSCRCNLRLLHTVSDHTSREAMPHRVAQVLEESVHHALLEGRERVHHLPESHRNLNPFKEWSQHEKKRGRVFENQSQTLVIASSTEPIPRARNLPVSSPRPRSLVASFTVAHTVTSPHLIFPCNNLSPSLLHINIHIYIYI